MKTASQWKAVEKALLHAQNKLDELLFENESKQIERDADKLEPGEWQDAAALRWEIGGLLDSYGHRLPEEKLANKLF